MAIESGNTVKSARTTLRILEALKERDAATVTELTREFDLSKSSIHNYLTTLEREGYVVKEGTRYRVSLKPLDLGGYARRRERLYDVAKQEVTELAEETGEMANLLVEEYGKGVYIHRAHGENAVKTDSYVGQRVHLHNTALGNAILANFSEERVLDVVERHGLPRTTPDTVADTEELFEKLARVREQNVAFDDEERLKGLRCVAVPIVNNDDVVEGAISVSGPTSRLRGDRFREELPEKLKMAANVIELNITYT